MAKVLNIFAVLFWIILASLKLHVSLIDSSMTSFLLALQSGVIAFFLIVRKKQRKNPAFFQQVFFWIAVGSPLLVSTNNCLVLGEIVVFLGTALSVWALKYLGKSFGIAPTDRGLVKGGPYKFIRHPMYAGELLALFGISIGCFSFWNIIIFIVVCVIFYIRIRLEEKVIKGYVKYKKEVPSRMIPGIW